MVSGVGESECCVFDRREVDERPPGIISTSIIKFILREELTLYTFHYPQKFPYEPFESTGLPSPLMLHSICCPLPRHLRSYRPRRLRQGSLPVSSYALQGVVV